MAPDSYGKSIPGRGNSASRFQALFLHPLRLCVSNNQVIAAIDKLIQRKDPKMQSRRIRFEARSNIRWADLPIEDGQEWPSSKPLFAAVKLFFAGQRNDFPRCRIKPHHTFRAIAFQQQVYL